MTFNITEGMEFTTLESAESAVQAEAKNAGFAVIRLGGYLKYEDNLKGHFLRLACSRWGVPKSKKAQTNTEINENEEENQHHKSKPRARKTKKTNCQFQLRIVEEDEKWIVKSMSNSHNHPMLSQDNIYALPAHRKLTTEQISLVADSMKTNTPTASTVKAINNLYPDCPHTTVKGVINKKAALRNALDAGRNKMSLVPLIQSLESKGYIIAKKQNKDGELTHLFFAHPSCLKQMIKCSEVLIVDATYKTNCFDYPMINAVGVSNVYGDRFSKEHGRALMNFQVALAWVCDEQVETYLWFFRTLKEHIYNACKKLPQVVITDRNKSIRFAVKEVYPQAKTMLCAWHMLSKELKDNTRTAFKSAAVYEGFSQLAWQLHYCKDQSEIPSIVNQLAAYCDQHCASNGQIQKTEKYIMSIMNEKEQWIRAYLDDLPHFNNYSTGRAESQHSSLKREILKANSLENAFEKFHNVIMNQQDKYNRSKTNSAISSNPNSRYAYILQKVTYKISMYAIDQLEKQIAQFFNEREKGIQTECTGFMSKVLCLPCHHQMNLSDPDYIIPLNMIHTRWYLELTEDELDIINESSSLVPKNVDEIDTKLDNVLVFIKSVVSTVPDNSSRLELIRKLEQWGKDNQNISEMELIKPKVQVVAKGRPEIVRREKLHCEKVEEHCIQIEKKQEILKRKRLQSEKKISTPSKRHKSKHFSFPNSQQKPLENFNNKQRNRLFGNLHYFSPDVVTSVVNVGQGGHCGFKALALLSGRKEKHFVQIRHVMRQKMNEVLEKYMNIDGLYSVSKLTHIMSHTSKENCKRDQWFSTPECAQLAAEALMTPIVVLQDDANDLYVPLLCKPENAKRTAPYVLRLSGEHFHAFFVDFKHPNIGNPFPFRLNSVTRNLLRTRHKSYFASAWEDLFPGCYADEHTYKSSSTTGPELYSAHASDEEIDIE